MTTIDPTDAVELAARAVYEEERLHRGGDPWLDLPPALCLAYREHVLPAVTAAAPVIEAAVRAQVAGELHEAGHHHAAHATRRASFWEGQR